MGIWVGSLSQSAPQNGLAVIGGHDSSRVDGEFTEFEYDGLCPTCVNVESMTFDWEDASTSLMDDDADMMRVQLNPFWRDLLVQDTMFDRFMNITGGTYTAGLGIHWRTESTPRGNITVTLEGGYTIVILPEHFFQYARGYQEDGSFQILGDELLIARLSNYTGSFIAHWGIPILTMNYLLVNHQNKSFKMAPAVQDLPHGAEPVIEPLCAPAPSSGSGGSNAGAIAGDVVGGLAGLALLGLSFWWFYFRKRRSARSSSSEGSDLEALDKRAPTELSSASEKGQLGGTETSPFVEMASPEQLKFDREKVHAKEMATPEQVRFDPDTAGPKEMASPEQMNGTIYDQVAKRQSLETTGISPATPLTKELYGSIPETSPSSVTQTEPVEMPADPVKHKD